MKYITTNVGKPIWDIYDRRGQWYTAEKVPKYQQPIYRYEGYFSSSPDYLLEAERLRQRPSELITEDSYLRPKLQEQGLADKESCDEFAGWEGYFLPPVRTYSNDCKEVDEKMDESTKEKLDNYLELLAEISGKTNNESTAVVLLQELSKDRRMQEIKEQREANNEKPATDKQRKFMDDLGIKYPKKVTKQEASMMIDEELGKNNG